MRSIRCSPRVRSLLRVATMATAALATLGGPAHAQAPSDAVPVTLTRATYDAPRTDLLLTTDRGGLNLVWHSTVPGLSFCVAYVGVRGLYSDLNDHCLIADRHGDAVDNVRLAFARDIQDPANVALLASVVLVDNRFSTVLVPIDTWRQNAIRKLSR